MYLCVYVYSYIHTYIHACVCIPVSINIKVCMHIYIYIYIYTYISVKRVFYIATYLYSCSFIYLHRGVDAHIAVRDQLTSAFEKAALQRGEVPTNRPEMGFLRFFGNGMVNVWFIYG